MEVPESLVQGSSLTHRQVELLLNHLRVRTGELRLREAADASSHGRTRGVNGKPVTVGSYYRTVNQAKQNLKESLATVVIGLWTGVIRLEDVRRLLEATGGNTRELTEEEAQRFAQVVQSLIDRIVA